MTTIDDTGTPERFDPTQQPPAVPVTITPLRGSVSMLEGSGGNVAASAGPDGILLVDTFYEVMWPELQKATERLSAEPVRFVAVTHWHPDHVGNNENLARQGAVIVGQDRMRARSGHSHHIKEVGITTPAATDAARPTVTFDSTSTFYLNGEQIDVLASAPSHSDTDSIVVFREANVIATGDLYSYGVYPLIDTMSGGSIDGTIAEVERIIAMSDDHTLIVAGHGPFWPDRPKADRRSVTDFRDMLVAVRDRVASAVEAGQGLAEVLAGRPSADLDTAWGAGMVAPDTFVTSVYDSLRGAEGNSDDSLPPVDAPADRSISGSAASNCTVRVRRSTSMRPYSPRRTRISPTRSWSWSRTGSLRRGSTGTRTADWKRSPPSSTGSWSTATPSATPVRSSRATCNG